MRLKQTMLGILLLLLATSGAAQTFTATATWAHDGVNLTQFQGSLDGAPFTALTSVPAVVPNVQTNYSYTLPITIGNHSFALRACNVTAQGEACSSSYTVAFNVATLPAPLPAPGSVTVTITVTVAP